MIMALGPCPACGWNVVLHTLAEYAMDNRCVVCRCGHVLRYSPPGPLIDEGPETPEQAARTTAALRDLFDFVNRQEDH
jgi:hypothetical protein